MADDVRSMGRFPLLLLFILIFLGIADAQITIENLAETFGNLFGSFGGGDECLYRCPDGSRPKKRPNYFPSSNGCGSMGIQLDTSQFPDMTMCCNKHDLCYDTCNSERDICDFDFKECLEDLCKKRKKKMSQSEFKNCVGAMNLMYAGTMALGCRPYQEAQRSACICSKKHGKTEL
ncbi:group XIIA secretory phospholipase A2-like [Liolophura sinensis]|uniref:group XIIA secretory phospholipase A2-like n=1 Tax=Liolophura sinensis TaxID=3198878 RepID=UPI0031583FE6